MNFPLKTVDFSVVFYRRLPEGYVIHVGYRHSATQVTAASQHDHLIVYFLSLTDLLWLKQRIKCYGFNYPPVSICSMYAIFTYIWVIFRVHVGIFCIHGAYGVVQSDN